jgi:prevent-host-death family protein
MDLASVATSVCDTLAERTASRPDRSLARRLDHGQQLWSTLSMREIAISKFKAQCLGVMEDVRRTGAPVRVTRFGKPVADIVPTVAEPKKSWLGCMADSMETTGDISRPIGAFKNWKALR